mgnify:CR=1 FL=1
MSGFITIIRAVADIYKRFRKKEEAEALEKAAQTIEAKKDIAEGEAKQLLVQILTDSLGKEKARPVIQYAENMEVLFPLKPEGTLLEYAPAIECLLQQLKETLSKMSAFELFGGEGYAVALRRTSRILTTHLRRRREISQRDKLMIFLKGMIHLSGEPPICLVHWVSLGAKWQDIAISVERVPNNPFVLRLYPSLGEKKGIATTIFFDAEYFRKWLKSIVEDARFYIRRVARESYQSRELSNKLSRSIQALKDISSVTRKLQ